MRKGNSRRQERVNMTRRYLEKRRGRGRVGSSEGLQGAAAVAKKKE